MGKAVNEQGSYSPPQIDYKPKVAITNVNVLTMESEDVLTNQTVLIDSGIITSVQSVELEFDEAYFQIEGDGKYLMPGLGDMHTHIEDERDLLLYLANGVTTVLNMGSTSNILDFKNLVKTGELRGPNIYAGAFVDGVDRGWYADTPERAYEIVREVKAQGWDFVKAYNSIKSEVFDALMVEARVSNMPVIGHGIREPGMEYILRAGYKMVAHGEEFIYAYFNRLDEAAIPDLIDLLNETGTYVTPNLSTYSIINLQWGEELTTSYRSEILQREETRYLSPEFIDKWQTTSGYSNRQGSLAFNFSFLKKMTKAMNDGGVPLLLGTDSPAPGILGTFPGFSIHDDLDNMVATGISPYDVYRAGTSNVGEFIYSNVPGVLPSGKVVEGHKADLILLDENPLSSVKSIKTLAGVLVNGEWLTKPDLDKMMDDLAKSYGK